MNIGLCKDQGNKNICINIACRRQVLNHSGDPVLYIQQLYIFPDRGYAFAKIIAADCFRNNNYLFPVVYLLLSIRLPFDKLKLQNFPELVVGGSYTTHLLFI